jgi:diguanylate cyclase (GGDEF)-like protein/PAS domain S-box-containing protein
MLHCHAGMLLIHKNVSAPDSCMGKFASLFNSLKTRLTIGTLAIFLVSLWTLSFYASRTLRIDMERVLGEQQFATVSLVADRLDHEFEDRIDWLSEAARQAEAVMADGPQAIQARLEGWKNLFGKFNGGTFVTDSAGIVVAAIPLSSGRVGVSYADRDYLRKVLDEGQAAISEPVMGRTSGVPVIVVAVPLRASDGRVVGALTGVINMGEPNFLDQATQNHYGKTGGYLLVAPQQRMIATATDKRRVMEVIPLGVSPLFDRFAQGFEGFGVTFNSLGAEILSAARQVPAAGWFVSGYLPTDEAFAAIREMERRMLAATIVLTLLAAMLSWWLLKRQLAPMLQAAESLSELSGKEEAARPLAVTREDEIGRLIVAFNRLLEKLGQRASLLKQILDTSSVAIFMIDMHGRITQANQRMCEMFGVPIDALLGSEYVALVHPSEREVSRNKMLALLASQIQSIALDRLYRRADQTVFWGHLTGRQLFDANGEKLGLVGVIADIDARKRAEEKNQLAASVFLHAQEGITITSADGTIIDVNEAFTRITGYAREEAIGQNPRILRSRHHPPEFYEAMWRELLETGNWSGEIWNRRKNGELYPELLTISAVRDEQARTKHYVALFSDITPMKAHEEQLTRMAHFDLLTTLPNRALLADRMKQAMTQTLRRKQLLAVAYLDLDGFKAINDTHGHKTGDQLLVAVANRMRQTLREGDTLARLGGDEFVVVLIDLPDVSSCEPMLNRLLAAASQPVREGDLELQVSASLGVTFFPQRDEVDADQLLRQADQAMYQAKVAGKNRFQMFDADNDRSLRGRHESRERIRQALRDGEFLLYYQPKVDMREGRVIGAEALIRWRHPEKGVLSPAAFLPEIENDPLAGDVDAWVLNEAVAQIARWQAAGAAIPVSVNVGACLLLRGDFVSLLARTLEQHPAVSPGDLTIEVLETSALEDLEGVSAIIAACRQLGARFALDDFGTGYSSLTYLKRLEADELKIDQSFVRDMLDDPDDLTILEGVISLAGAFQREVIAEGGETAAHGEMLLLLGCDLAQGYGIARPMPAEELAAWATNWRPDPCWKSLRPVRREELPALFAGTEHRAWVKAVEKAGKAHCRFGKWLLGEGTARHGAHPEFAEIARLHDAIHVLVDTLCDPGATVQTPEHVNGAEKLRELSDMLLSRLNDHGAWRHPRR